MSQKTKVRIGIGVCIFYVVIMIASAIHDHNTPDYRDTRSAREKRISAEEQLRQERLNRAIQDEIIRIDQKNSY